MADNSGSCPVPAAGLPAPGPAPNTGNTCRGALKITAGSNLDWKAPDFSPSSAPNLANDADAYSNDFEDLALWTETAKLNNLGGGGSLVLAGVFMAPNAAPLDMGGNASSDNVNAQFVASQVKLSGTADFYLKSDSHNAVPLPGPPVTGLVR